MNTLLTASSFIFPLITFKYVSGIILPSGTGKVSFVTSIVTYFNLFAQLGIPTYGIRAIAKSRDNPDEMSRITIELLLINLISVAFSYAILFFLVTIVDKLRIEKNLFIAICPLIFFKAIGIEWMYKGLEKYSFITVRSIICQLIALISMFFLIKSESDYVWYGVVSVIASSAGGILNFIHARKIISVKSVFNNLNLKRHLKPILVFSAMSFATTVYTNLDVAMLGFIKDDVQVGFYDASVKIKNVLVVIVTSLGAVVLPRASYYIEHNLKNEFRKVIKKTLEFAIAFSIPLILFFCIFSSESILFISGPAYNGAIIPMMIIMPTVLLIGVTNVLGIELLVPTGREKIVLYSVIAGAISDFLLNMLLIPVYGASGAALGTLFAEIIVLIVQYCCLKKELRDYVRGIPFVKIVVFSFLAGVSCYFAKIGIIDRMNCENTFLRLLIGAAVIFLVYGILLLFLCKKELKEFREI